MGDDDGGGNAGKKVLMVDRRGNVNRMGTCTLC